MLNVKFRLIIWSISSVTSEVASDYSEVLLDQNNNITTFKIWTLRLNENIQKSVLQLQ